MKGKCNRIRRFISIVCMILVFTLAVPCVAEAAPASWSVKMDDDGDFNWYCTGRKGYFYVKDYSVYHHINGKDKKIGSWKDKEYISIDYGRGDWLYISQSNVLYGYNLKTGKKKAVIRNYNSAGQYIGGCGPYIYSSEYSPTGDYSPFIVWKLSGGTAKKVRTLGKRVRVVYPVGKYIYYDDFEDIDNLQTVSLYKCSPNGGGKKKMFSLQLKNGRIFPNIIWDNEYTVYMDDYDAKTSTLYSYNFKTDKLSVKSVVDFS